MDGGLKVIGAVSRNGSTANGSAVQLERTAPGASTLVDVLDRVLDKGIVIDAWVRVSLVGIEVVTVEARVEVASIATYLGSADVLSELKSGSPEPATDGRDGTRRR
jgi:hypothetical protein